jgi:hypothetical protein
MEKDMVAKINEVLEKGVQMTEHELRSAMVLIRKMLELMPERVRSQYLLLNLFCTWAVHTEITQSNTGLRILAKVNDALVGVRHSGDPTTMGLKMSEALSFTELRRELKEFLGRCALDDKIVNDDKVWGLVFLPHLIEILRDVPLAFPQVLDPGKQRIYDQIAQNPIKPGARVVSICLARVNYEALGAKGLGERLCVLIKTADTTTVVIPLTIDVRLR